MKVLHISDQPPGHFSGGQIGILQFSYAWTHVVDKVDYIGPKIIDTEIVAWYNQCFFLDRKLNIIQKVWSLCHLQFDRKYLSWKKMKIDFSEYDLIYIDFTKMDYAIKDIKKSEYKGKIIVRAHNVEADFFRVNFMSQKSLMGFLQYIVAKPRERYMVKKADSILAITEQDKNRITDLYAISKDKINICPVGVNIPQNDIKLKSKISAKLKCLITGSLWFGPNVDATIWFITKVYPRVSDICDITVAGFKPNESLKKLCIKNGIKLIDSPESMQPFFEQSDMVLAPIFDGGGMKVKIAEAMSYGLPIVTTSHGAIGYDFKDHVNAYIADTEEEFENSIKDYYNLDEQKRMQFLENAWDLYLKKYSLYAIKELCKSVIETLNE